MNLSPAFHLRNSSFYDIFNFRTYINSYFPFYYFNCNYNSFDNLFFVDEIVLLYDSCEKGLIVSFFCITRLLVTRWVYSGLSAIFTQSFITFELSTQIHQPLILISALQFE
ncbi:hypothetical protein M9H77_30566 [Catharanthus roseus]|uniref:Uncharacterized protein n=1 Tax=Catharanthus roseus TaxID=4058 RepID=A0ACB9ZXY5_CATRO|nr:hypothetical protein M9H77_30566 [Catharanthus roseus]